MSKVHAGKSALFGVLFASIGTQAMPQSSTSPSGAGVSPPSLSSPRDASTQGARARIPGLEVRGREGEVEPPALTQNQDMSSDRIEGFNSAIDQAFPMTPEMIRRYQQIYNETQRAILEKPEPKAMMTADFVSLTPGDPPPVLRVSPGVASVVTFMDAAGNHWPIVQYVVGNAAAFQVIDLGEGSNALTVTPLSPIGTTNLVVVLEGASSPVVMRVLTGSENAHFRHDIQIADLGPNTDPSITDIPEVQSSAAGTQVLLSALTNADLPSGARRLAIDGVDADAWRIGDDIYLRSKHALISPSWMESMAGPDGVRVYRIPSGSSLLFSVNGRITRATVNF